MKQVLDGRVSDLEIGAFAIAMRIKGETADELAGFLDATHDAASRSEPGGRRVLPSYNGARKLPNLTALLALLLAQEGVRCWCTARRKTRRVTTAAIFHDLGLPFANDARDRGRLARREPVFVRTEALCPPLARLLEVRVSSACATPATPSPSCSSLHGARRCASSTTPTPSTRPCSRPSRRTGADAVLMRGTEGEPVADPRRAQRLDVYVAGERARRSVAPAQEGVLPELPVLPRSTTRRPPRSTSRRRQRREAGAGTVAAAGRVPDAGPRRDQATRAASAAAGPGRAAQ